MYLPYGQCMANSQIVHAIDCFANIYYRQIKSEGERDGNNSLVKIKSCHQINMIMKYYFNACCTCQNELIHACTINIDGSQC